MRIESGEIWLDDRPTGLKSEGNGNATLFFRPQEVEIVDGCGGCFAGTVISSRRLSGTRRLELELGGARHLAEIDVPVDHPAATRTGISFRPKRWKVYPASA